MSDPHAFNLGHDCNFQFHPPPQRLMDEDIYIGLEGGRGVGDTLRVLINRPKMIDISPSDFATQWHRDEKSIPWENARTYVIREEDHGHTIGCWVTDAKKLGSELISVQ